MQQPQEKREEIQGKKNPGCLECVWIWNKTQNGSNYKQANGDHVHHIPRVHDIALEFGCQGAWRCHSNLKQWRKSATSVCEMVSTSILFIRPCKK